MADLSRLVATNFTANTAKFNAPVQQMAGVASSAGSAVSKMTSLLAPLAAGLGAFAAMKGIASIGSEFEDANVVIAGFLTAIGKTGTYDEGLQAAAKTMRAITVSAASLPGEAEDYVRVFQAGMVVVDNATHGTLKDVYTFTNQFAAISSTLGIESTVAARDLTRLMDATRGHAGQTTRTWSKLLNIAKGMPEYASLTAEKFNAMSAPKRLEVLKGIMGKMQPMLDRAAATWTAQIGALTSNTKMLVREASAPLFEGMKSGLGEFNAMFIDADGNWTAFGARIVRVGKLVSTYLVSAFTLVGYKIQNAILHMKALGEAIRASPVFKAFDKLSGTLLGVAKTATSSKGTAINTAAKVGVFAAGGGPALSIIAGGLANALSRPGAIEGALAKAGKYLNTFAKALSPLMRYIDMISSLIGDAVTNILPPFLDAVMSMVSPLLKMMSAIWGIGRDVLARLRPAFHELTLKIGVFYRTVASAVTPALRLLGAAATWVFQHFAKEGTPKLIMFLHVIGGIVKVMIWAISKIAKVIGFWAGKILGPEKGEGQTGSGGDVLSDIMRAMSGGNVEFDKAHSVETPESRPTAETYQDFRGSKFDVIQKFAEGFDPDRVAIALASDLGRIGEQKLQSGYEPAFGIR